MITEKEHKVSNENYEISKKYIIYLKSIKTMIKNYKKNHIVINIIQIIYLEVNKKIEVVPVEEQIELVEYKKQKWYQKIYNIIKGLFKRK